jgi:hypothetical protein
MVDDLYMDRDSKLCASVQLDLMPTETESPVPETLSVCHEETELPDDPVC